MSPVARGEDGGGEARSKRIRQRGAVELTEVGETMARRRKDDMATVVQLSSADTRPRKERRGRRICSSTRS
jgi:hypothetical protein